MSIRPLLCGLVVTLCATAAHADLAVPIHNSLPGAPATLYLDFDGDNTPTWDTYSPGITPAYDVDGNPSSFSPQEKSNIDEIWARVAEKYSPFNINVTTVDPGTYDNYKATRVVIGGTGAWTGVSAGGISNYYSFTNAEPNLGFVFSGIWNGDPKHVAEASAHEAGHGFGLYHQSIYTFPLGPPAVEYNPGDAYKAPIMGVSYDSIRGLWWLGRSSRGYTNIQDDMAVIASTSGANANLFGYRPDDHANSIDTLGLADVLSIAPDLSISAQGIIEQTTDQDFLSFHTDGGYATFNANVAPFGPMLDLSMYLYNSADSLIASEATSSLGETMTLKLDPGTYYLDITSAGNYGDVGQYSITGSLIPEPTTALAALLLTLPLLRTRA